MPWTTFQARHPPDPAGDVGPNHYVAMTNLSYAVYDKSGNLQFGPAANNTIWSGFGGACENENAGDPIVLYDQISDRWLLSQFTSAGPQFFNCVALSTTPDPTGTYFRWAIQNSNGGTDLFPDYPKYGIWRDGFYISTRDFNGGSYAGVGAYAIDRDDMVTGNPNPNIIYFFVDRSTDPWQVGDGLLPADIDGSILPAEGTPQYFVGTMDDGGPYGAANDALSFWEFDADFDTPANSTFTRTALINMASYDTQFPCGGGRNCIAQEGTANRIDIQSYRQRPLHRLAYRNFGTHESLVTNQSVESSANIGGIRWWELRDLDTAPVIHQEGTFGPGSSDGISRWMGSIAQDADGNMGLAYSASSSAIHPAIRFTGRLESDPLNTMDRSEGSIVEGTGSQTSSQRWGDYTSVNIDPVDDCTFWHVNEYHQADGGNWQIRVGSFKFNECGDPGFVFNAADTSIQLCNLGADASDTTNVDVVSLGQHAGDVTLAFNPTLPTGISGMLSPNPVTIGNPFQFEWTVAQTVVEGQYTATIEGTSPGVDNNIIDFNFDVVNSVPVAANLTAPADGATDVLLIPTFTWDAIPNVVLYSVEVATDDQFTNMIDSGTSDTNSYTPTSALPRDTELFWRVTADSVCGTGATSAIFSFRTNADLCFVVNQAIPDNDPAGLDVIGNVMNTGTITDVMVSVAAEHTWVGDLIMSITKDGTTVTLMDRPGVPAGTFGCSGDDVDVLFDDASGTPVEDECANLPAITGTLQPQEALSVFAGAELSGDWTFNINDNAAQDTGSLLEFCIFPTLEQGPVCDPPPPVGDQDVIWFNGFQCVEAP